MSSTIISIQEQEHFTSASREAIFTAQHEAVRMNATEVSPEHLFLGVLAQDGDEVAEAFSTLRLDREVLREQAATLFPPHRNAGKADERNVPLSREAQACLEWAITFAAHMHISLVRLEHVLLASVRHQRLQPLLVLFLSEVGSVLPSYVTEHSGPAYTTAMDQLITSRIRQRSVVRFTTGVSSRTLSRFERPALLFSDIAGFHGVKQDLREVIDFLKKPQLTQQNVRSYLYGLLLIGPAGTSRTLLGQAIAGEAVVPLLSLSFPTLVEAARSSSSDSTDLFDVDRLPRGSSQAERETMAQRGRRSIHGLFEQGRNASPCVICIDELDALEQPDMKETSEQWQSQLRIEMDGCDTHPAMAVVATISRREKIDPSLLVPGRFDHTATLDGTIMKPFEAGLTLCSTCQQEVPANWKYCGFCGTVLARTCPQCAAVRPEVKGVHFCPHCGYKLGER